MINVAQKPSAFYLAVFVPNYKTALSYFGYVKSLSSNNSKGPFDILPMHENFVTVALSNLVVVDENSKRLEFPTQKAVVEVSENVAKVFVAY